MNWIEFYCKVWSIGFIVAVCMAGIALLSSLVWMVIKAIKDTKKED
jgi:hypothetical protein